MDRTVVAQTRATRTEDTVTILVSLWMVIGLLVDAFKHSTDPQLESFWTPWHALFYSGFLATAAWLLWVTYRRFTSGTRFWDAAPLGHRAALAGIAIFAIGGAGDAIWHEIWGVETSLDALLSPTHLLLFVGMLLIVTTPFRAAWTDRHDASDRSLRDFLPTLASLTFATMLVAFFFEYAWVPAADWVPRQRYVPDGDSGEFFAAFGVMGIMVTTFIMMPPVLLACLRWRPPFGSFVVLFLAVNVFIAVAFDEDLSGILPALLAGLTADALVAADVDRRVTALAVPVVMWSTYFVVVGRIEPGLLWPPEIWGGAIVFSALASLAMQVGLDAAARLPVAEGRVREQMR